MWEGDACNEIRGTESSIFPPFGVKEDGVWAFEGGICRSMNTVYEKKTKYKGLPTLRFVLDMGDIQVSFKCSYTRFRYLVWFYAG